MVDEAQSLTCPAGDLLHCSNVLSFQGSAGEREWVGALEKIVQNKANLQRRAWEASAFVEKSYERFGPGTEVAKQSQFPLAGTGPGGQAGGCRHGAGVWRQRFFFIHPPASGRVCTAHQCSADGVRAPQREIPR